MYTGNIIKGLACRDCTELDEMRTANFYPKVAFNMLLLRGFTGRRNIMRHLLN